eukprot:2171459-Pleurochrysis_carterae.AAC.3
MTDKELTVAVRLCICAAMAESCALSSEAIEMAAVAFSSTHTPSAECVVSRFRASSVACSTPSLLSLRRVQLNLPRRGPCEGREKPVVNACHAQTHAAVNRRGQAQAARGVLAASLIHK